MERGVERRRGVRGGILSLVQIINEHDRALEYELMTRTGRTLTEYMEMGAAGMVALLSFINYLPKESVLYGILEPGDESREWYMPYKTNQMIADLFDLTAAANTKKGHVAPTYPRPTKKNKIGSGAVAINEFDDWWNGGD